LTVSDTSRMAYESLDLSTITRVRDKVLFIVANATHPSNADIERLTGIRLSSVCARVNELCQEGIIERGGVKIDPFTKKTVSWWRLA